MGMEGGSGQIVSTTSRMRNAAVVEGTFHDDLSRRHYKLIETLDISQDATHIYDGIYRYKRLSAYQNNGVIETIVDSLGMCDGLHIPDNKNFYSHFELPRLIYFPNNRIYIEERHIDEARPDRAYLRYIPEIVTIADALLHITDRDLLEKFFESPDVMTH